MLGESLLARYRAAGKYPRVILLVLIGAVAGYALFVQTHLQQIHEFNNRELGHGAKIVEDIVAGIVTTAEKWDKAKGLCRFSLDQPYLTHNENACTEKEKEWDGKVVKSADLETKNRKLQIHFALGDTKTGPGVAEAAFDVDFAAILKELDLPESFELYFIADSKGRIVHSGSSNHLRPLRDGGWLNQHIAGEDAEPGSARRIGNLANLTEIASQKKPFEQFKAGTTQLRIDLAGVSNYLYVQPLDLGLPDDENSGSGEWFLGGAVSYDDVLRRSFAVDSYLLFGLVLIVALGFLGWPFLKILLIDARERFRSADVYELLFSAVALTALLMVLGLSWDAYSRLKDKADDNMKTLAKDLATNLVSEIKVAREQLETYDKVAEGFKIDVSHYTSIAIGSLRSSGGMPEPPVYWPVRLTWAGSDGKQFLKAETKLDLTPPANVAARPYFQGIQSGETWSIDGSPGFLVHPGRSIVDGKFYSFLAMPSKIHSPPPEAVHAAGSEGPAVALMSLNLRSVAAQPMPIGYGFAVVNREGHTLYHNDSRRVLREDFVEEVEQHYHLNAALQSDSDQFLSLTYQTRPHRFYLRPLHELKKISAAGNMQDGPGWFVIVYRDLTGAHAIATRAIVLSLIFSVGGTLVLGLVALLLMRYVSGRLYGGRTAAWMWPSQRGPETYRELVIWSAVLLVGGLAAIAFADGPALVVLSMGLPPLVGALWIGIQLRNRRDAQTESPVRWRLQWTAGALFVLCFAVPLASGFFKFFWNDEIGRYQYAQDFDRFESRDELIAAARREAHCQPSGGCPQLKSVENYLLMPEKLDPPRDDGQLASFLSGWMPVQDSVVARIRDFPSARLPLGAPGGGGLSLYCLFVLPAVILAWFWVKIQSQWILLDELAQPEITPRAARSAAAVGGSVLSQGASHVVPDFESWWSRSSDDSKRVILQVTAERIANPRARHVLKELLEEGALVFEPDLGPRPEWREELKKRLISESAQLRVWETPENATGWTSARWTLLLAMAGISFFLIATQPNLPAQLGALVSTTTVAVSTIRRGFDALGGRAKVSE